jgi:aspartyl/glutamyl-tRNA(Asn/Gln) amidotransferase C subunit
MMAPMSDIDIQHLSRLARITVTNDEVSDLQADLKAVLEYVSAVDEITAADGLTKRAGAVRNVFRSDNVTTEPESFTESLLAAAPARNGRWLKVQRILNQD